LDLDAVESFLNDECRVEGDQTFHRATGRRVAAILPVHIFGNLVNMERLLKVSKQFWLKVVEDATEALGSAWIMNGSTVLSGNLGDFGCFSFNGNKLITTGGGGMVVSRDPSRLPRIRHLSTQAKVDPLFFDHEEVGFNYRMTSIQAAVGIAQLKKLPHFLQRRQEIHSIYRDELKGTQLELVAAPQDTVSNYWLNAVRIPGANEAGLRKIIANFEYKGIQLRPIWRLNHLHKHFSKCIAYRLDGAKELAESYLNIPSSNEMTNEQVRNVAKELLSGI
jgi:perosamine synthetase